jgi:polyferredoxin
MIRKVFVAAVGVAQVMIGALSILFTYIFHSDLFNVQATFWIPTKNVSLYVLLFLVFSLFSLISGLSFVQEWRS